MLVLLNDISTIGVMMFVLLSLVFWLAGHTIRLFVVAFIGLLISLFFLGTYLGENHAADQILIMAGFILYFGGLLIVRTILRRSVSLHLLLNLETGTPVEIMKSEINDRLGDMMKYKLAIEQNDMLHLTGWGQLVAGITTLFFKVFGLGK